MIFLVEGCGILLSAPVQGVQRREVYAISKVGKHVASHLSQHASALCMDLLGRSRSYISLSDGDDTGSRVGRDAARQTI